MQFKKGSLALRVILKDEALAALQKVVADYQSDEEALPVSSQVVSSFVTSPPGLAPTAAVNGDTVTLAKAWLANHSPGEALNLIGWKTNPEKILILGAYHESKQKEESDWRSSDIEQRFSEARESVPANLARDVSNAVKGNFLAPVTYRTYRISRTGWNKMAEVIASLPVGA